MAAYWSSFDDLVLHGPRVLGFSTAGQVAARYGLDIQLTEERLLDYEAYGWARHSRFADAAGWSVTDLGRAENERRLAAELGRSGARDAVGAAHTAFLPLNRRFGKTVTRWQLRPSTGDPMAPNDHTDWGWDEAVLRSLAAISPAFEDVCGTLSAALRRFEGYAERYAAALSKVDGGHRRWVDAPDLDSCHTVWIQLHEDLLATLGIARGDDA